MPGRGSETGILKWQNTAQAMRNIFVHNGRVKLIFEYNKTRALTDRVFYVIRVLSVSVSRLWFLYLTYIRPFVDCLRHCRRLQLTIPANEQQAYTFITIQGRLYSTTQLSEGLRKLSLEVCQYPLTIGSYRQVVAAIAKRYVKELVTTATAAATSDPAFQAIAHQFGHAPRILDGHYGLDQSYPDKLQPELMANYERTSACWQSWLELATFEQELLRAPVAVVAAPAVATAGGAAPRKRAQADARDEASRKRHRQKALNPAPTPRLQVPLTRPQITELLSEIRQAVQMISASL